MRDEKHPSEGILVLNSGSSSIKFSLFVFEDLQLIFTGQVKEIYTQAKLIIKDAEGQNIENTDINVHNHSEALNRLLEWIDKKTEHMHLMAIGHRVVHGGMDYQHPVIINERILEDLKKLIPLAPLHQGHNLHAISVMQMIDPNVPQIACFDTAFHATQDLLSKDIPLPRKFTEMGIKRYGFHGLSYGYIASILPEKIGKHANDKLIIAHLGNGASLCAIENQKSVATSMGFTALEGLMMGTRSGSIDPGALLYILEAKHYTVSELSRILYEESGLLGVSELSSDMQTLCDSGSPQAKLAIDLFCYRAAKEMGALFAALKGCKGIIFTAGIGEHSALVRAKILSWFEWLNITLDDIANSKNAFEISHKDSAIPVYVIPTNEEYFIALQTRDLVRG